MTSPYVEAAAAIVEHRSVLMTTPDGVSTRISEAAALAIRNNALCREGNVSIQGIPGGFIIKDRTGTTTLVLSPQGGGQ